MPDLNNLFTIAFQQCVILALPLSVLAFAVFLAIRLIPSRLTQYLVSLVAGIILAVFYTSMNPSNPGESATILFVTGVLIHPFLILPPILVMQKNLYHLPVFSAVFLSIFLSLCIVISSGIFLGDVSFMRDSGWRSIIPVITDLLAASIASGFVITLDRFSVYSEKNRSQQ